MIDVVGAKHSGAARVLVELVHAAIKHPVLKQITLLLSPQRLRQFDLPDCSHLRVVDVEGAESELGRIHWALSGLSKAVREHQADVFLGMNGLAPTVRHCPGLVFIQQSLPLSPEIRSFYNFKGRLRLKALFWLTQRSACGAEAVIVQTAAMRDAVVKQYGVSRDRISVHPPGPPVESGSSKASAAHRVMQQHSGRTKLLYVGNSSPHKNLQVLANAMALRRARGCQWFATLPPEHPYCRKGLAISLGRVAPEDLESVYREADILVMPSLIETVGLPMLEAMHAGTVVLGADRPYAHAVCEDAALFFDPHNPEDLLGKIERLTRNPALAKDLKAKAALLVGRRLASDAYNQMVEVVLQTARKQTS